MSTITRNRKVVIDDKLIKKLETFRKNVHLIAHPNETYSVDLSYFYQSGGKRLDGQFVRNGRNVQGCHTISYTLLLTALERRLNGKSLVDMLKQIDSRVSTQPTLNNDLYTFFYIYSQIGGKFSNIYLLEKLKLVFNSTMKLFAGLFLLDENRFEDFKTLLYDYLYNYILCLQYIPFAASEKGSPGRGERMLNTVTTEREFIGYASKLFDEEAIKFLYDHHAKGKHEFFAKQAKRNIVAYQLMGLLFMLEAYPMAKRFFFHHTNTIDKANLPNIATVIFCNWKKDDSKTFNAPLNNDPYENELVKDAFFLIIEQRFTKYRYKFM